MNNMFYFLQNLIISKITSQNNMSWTGKLKLEIGLSVISGFFILLGLTFIVLSSYLWMQKYYEADFAASMTGLLAIGLAVLFSLLAFMVCRTRRIRVNKVQSEIKDALVSAFKFLEDELAEPVSQNPKISVLLASVAGFIAAERFR